MSITLSALQKQRTDTAANWTSENPTLLSGELGFESDTGKAKLGDGSTAWTSLGYLGLINSSGDYPLSQLLLPLGSASAPSLAFTGDVNTGLYSPGADQLAISTNGQGRLFIDSSGNVGVGTASPSGNLDVRGLSGTTIIRAVGLDSNGNADAEIFSTGTSGNSRLYFSDTAAKSGSIIYSHANNQFAFATNGSTALSIDSSGRLGVGTTNPVNRFVVSNNGNEGFEVVPAFSSGLNRIQHINRNTSAYIDSVVIANTHQFWKANTTEAARIDSSGRLLVGTSNAVTGAGSQYARLSVIGNTTGSAGGGRISIGRGVPATSLTSNSEIGQLYFTDSTNGEYALIGVYVDGTPGANDYPGRLVFSSTASGSSSPTERMRIASNGALIVAKTSTDFGVAGISYIPGNSVNLVRSGGPSVAINRLESDGSLVNFYQASTGQGSISVSGTTVSYNGAHLSRWSQLPSGAERTEILRGSVLSNIDEMCEWGDEDNEQLNRMKVSDIEGDKNVSGVFQAWDDDDDTYTNDFYCAMTGDFVIRIAQNTTVARGDLLMSAGDGTAKPQDDDIVRSKTIAKVTSTNVSCTYDDGSYCVPCVLMAC